VTLHGQPIPWDDGAAAFIKFDNAADFLDTCEDGREVSPGVKVYCRYVENECIRVWLESIEDDDDDDGPQSNGSPFLDVFLFRATTIEGGASSIVEVGRNGSLRHQKTHGVNFSVDQYFPTQPYWWIIFLSA